MAQLLENKRSASASGESELYDFLAALKFEDLPEHVVEATLALILDQFGCALFGMQMEWTQTLRKVVAAQNDTHMPAPGQHGAVVYGTSAEISPLNAALINGTATHGFDLDDLHLPTMSHPGCLIIPAAVAAAQSVNADGKTLIAAIVAGYEMMGRVGLAAGLQSGELGFHATATFGPTGAAVAATKVLGGDRAAIANAVGIAASYGGGIKAFSRGPGWVKRLHAGKSAEAGIFSAQLAIGGFLGPDDVLAGKFGLVPVFSLGEQMDVEALTRDLGSRFVVEDVYIKPFAACGAVHGAVQAADVLHHQLKIEPGQIDRIVVGTSKRALAQNSNTNPTDLLAAQYSSEYCVAVALLGGARQPKVLLEFGTASDEEARKLTPRIQLEVNEEAERNYPDSNEGSVEIHFSDGRVVSDYGRCSESSSSGWQVASEKFRGVTHGILTAEGQQRAMAATRSLAEGASINTCTEVFADPQLNA